MVKAEALLEGGKETEAKVMLEQVRAKAQIACLALQRSSIWLS